MTENIIPVYCEVKVHQWRRNYDIPPPNGEYLEDMAERTISFFKIYFTAIIQQ